MKKSMILGMGMFSFSAVAAGPVAITTFASGTPISSSAVNANFSNLKTVVDNYTASNAGNFIFPGALGSNGQVLVTDGAGNLSWSTPAGGGGISMLNGEASSVQSFTTGITGSMPNWTTAGGVHTLNLPYASSGGTTAGLLSYSDYMNFNNKMSTPPGSPGQFLMYTGSSWQGQTLTFVSQGGDSVGTIMTLGTNSAQPLGLKTNGAERVRINQDGKVGVGNTSPSSALHVTDGYNMTSSSAGLTVDSDMSASSGWQYGMKVNAMVNQASGAGYAGLLINVQETTVGGGTKKFIEMKKSGTSVFSVDTNGFMSSTGFMGRLTSNTTVSCYSTPSYLNSTQVTTGLMTFDFGNSAIINSAPAGVYEVIVDLPWTLIGGTPMDSSVILFDNLSNAEIMIKPGRHVKRLPAGNWDFRVGCQGTSGSISLDGSKSVLGLRRLH